MKTLLICHAGDSMNEVGLARWLASFSDLRGIVIIRETQKRKWQRIRREIRRVGLLRFFDVIAFRAYYRFTSASRDQQWEREQLSRLCAAYEAPQHVPILYTSSPNSDEAREFIASAQPDITIARCKTLLKQSIFSIPQHGTFVMHPGICPEYRNAHGCFWAVANGDDERVGMTLLRVDKGVDTGGVYGYYTCDFDPVSESHVVIQHRVVFDNLDELRRKLQQIHAGEARTIDTSGRASAAWGQPWLSRYLRGLWSRSGNQMVEN
jgi:hypothetical protein